MLSEQRISKRHPHRLWIRRATPDRIQKIAVLGQGNVAVPLGKLILVYAILRQRLVDVAQLMPASQPQPQVVIAHVLIATIEAADRLHRRRANACRWVHDKTAAGEELEMATGPGEIEAREGRTGPRADRSARPKHR